MLKEKKTSRSISSSSTVKLAESSLLIGLGTILSMISLVNLPYGGSVTLFSMVPILILSYRYGVKWGLFSALAYAFLQMMIGITNLSYGADIWSKISIILFDYLIAFTGLGLGGLFKDKFKKQTKELVCGAVLPVIIRYLCHVFAGATVWAGLSIPSKQAIAFSFIYNASYMIPETIVTFVGVIFLSNIFNFSNVKIVRNGPDKGADSEKHTLQPLKKPDLAILFSTLSKIFAVAGFIAIVIKIFAKLQSESDGFDITLIKNVNFIQIAVIATATFALFLLFHFLSKSVPADSKVRLNQLFSKLPYLVIATLVAYCVYLVASTAVGGNFDAKSVMSIVVTISITLIISLIIIIYKVKKKSEDK